MSITIPTFVWVLTHFGLASWAIYHALLYKRDSRSALGWIMISIFLPYAGAIAYYLFGINRVRSRAQNLNRGLFSISYELGEQQFTSTEIIDHALKSAGQRVTGHLATSGNNIVPLFNGHMAYPAMLASIDKARHSIMLSTYILKYDATGKKFINSLEAAVARGIKVRVLLDGIGAFYSRKSISRILNKKNIDNALFLPPKLIPPSIYINLRNHRKLLIVDNEIAFAGGMNISDDHNSMVQGESGITDIHFSLQGPVVAELSDLFSHDWKFARSDKSNTGMCLKPEPCGDMDCRVIPDGPDHELDSLTLTIQSVISAAKVSVDIMTPYFLPSRELIASLQTAALRGIKVRIVLPEKNNLVYIHWANRNILAELLILNISVYYQPAPFCHSKLLTVDSEYSIIGSANLDPRSLRLNFELGIEVFSESFNQALKDHFEKIIIHSRMITFKELSERPVATRLRDSAAALLSPYL